MSHTPEDKDSLLKVAQLRRAFYVKLDVKLIEKILQMKGDINYRVTNSNESTDYSVLHFAKRRDQTLEVFQLLLDYGADFTIKNHEEETVLLQCVDEIDLEFIEYNHEWGLGEKLSDEIVAAILSAHVQKSVSVNPENKNGLTHFHMACMANHVEAVQMFLDSGVPVDLVVGGKSSVFPGCTGLHIAVRSCGLKVVMVLLKCGADPSAKDRDGMTVIHWLIDNSMKIVDSLIVKEVEISRLICEPNLRMNKDIMTCIIQSSLPIDKIKVSKFQIACFLGDASMIRQFLSEGAQIDAKVSADCHLWPGYTALHFAANWNIDTVLMLVERGANIMAESANGITPFDICLERYSIKDIHLVMSLQPSWKNIKFLGGKIKLLKFVSAMKNIERFRSFLDKHSVNINKSIDRNSPIWPGFTPLHLAVIFSRKPQKKSGYRLAESSHADLALVEECLSRGADVTAKDASGCTPLHLAFRHQRTSTIEKLLQSHRSTSNPVDRHSVSHLHIACASGNKDVVEKLLESGANPNLRVSTDFKFYRREAGINWLNVERIHAGSTPLHIAVASKQSKVARILVDSGADVNVTDENGATPLHCLLLQKLSCGDEEMAEILLSANPTPMTVSGAGITHLHVASCFDHVDAVKRLLDLGTNIDARLGSQSELDDFYERYKNGGCGPRNYENLTALEIAVWNFSPNVVELLIERGADVLARHPCGWGSLYGMLSDNVDRGALQVLARLAAEDEVLAKRLEAEYGLTALHLACSHADVVSVRRLIDSRAEVNARLTEKALNWAGSTPLHMVLGYLSFADPRSDVFEVAEILLAAGADVLLCNAEKQTPLHLIFPDFTDDESDGEFKIHLMNVMLNSIKDFHVNSTDEEGWSHFLFACWLNNHVIIEKFLEHGVDVNATISLWHHREAGSSALHLIARKSPLNIELKAETINALLTHGAAVNAPNADGDTVLHVIARDAPDRADVFRSLLRSGADITKLNTLCETPFATLLHSKKATPEVIELFIGHGCSVNEFNVVDQQGFLAGPLCASDSTLGGRTRIFEALFESRDIAQSDATGRTAIHNIVSAAGFRLFKNVSEWEYSRLIAKLYNVGCDIDSQDQSGKTALHLAARFKNGKAIAALLVNGADVNIVDKFGKTAFTYGADFCRCDSKRKHRHNDVISLFFNHLRKMSYFNLYITKVNGKTISKVNALPGFAFYIADDMKRLHKEVNKISLVKCKKNSGSFKLIDLLSETGLVAVYPFKASIRLSIHTFFRGINVYLVDCTEIIGLIKYQIRKAVKRVELIDPVTEAFNEAVGFPFPETCSFIVFRHLSNSDMENLIRALRN